MTYELELNKAMEIAKQVGDIASKLYFEGNIKEEIKEDGTKVTNIDRLANELIQHALEREFPTYGIVSEEQDNKKAQQTAIGELAPTFYIDPIDGTNGLTNGSYHSAIHIGLAHKGESVMGIVHHFYTGEMFVAAKDWGSYQITPSGTHKKLEVNPEYDLEKLFISQRSSDYKNPARRAIVEKIKPHKLLFSGSQGLRMVKVATNTADLHLLHHNNGCKTWDICAPHAIVKYAGGHLLTSDGTPLVYEQQEALGKGFILASSEELAQKIQEIIGEKF